MAEPGTLQYCKHELAPGSCADCLGIPEHPPCEHRLRPVFTATYPGQCGCCGRHFDRGADVAYDTLPGTNCLHGPCCSSTA